MACPIEEDSERFSLSATAAEWRIRGDESDKAADRAWRVVIVSYFPSTITARKRI